MNLKFIFSELLNNKKFTLLFIVNFAIGLSGFLALDTFKNSLDSTLKSQSKAILGADFGVSSRRRLSEGENKTLKSLLPNGTVESKMIETYSMVQSPSGKTQLVQLKAIDKGFPFYGYVELEKSGKYTGSSNTDLLNGQKVWLYPELQAQLAVKPGDKIKIGDLFFEIDDIVINDSAAGISTNMAPRVYIGREMLLKTNLIRQGSLAWFSKVYKIPNLNIDELNTLRDQAFEGMDDSSVRVYTHENSSEQLGRVLGYLNDFLGLTALAALFLSAIGGSFLFRNYLRQRIQQIAILISLGMTPFKAIIVNLLQVTVLGLISSIVALLISVALLPALSNIISEISPVEVQLTFGTSTLFIAVILGSLACTLIALPLLAQLRNLKPSLLLNQGQTIELKWDAVSVLFAIPALIIFWLLSISQANSIQTGSLFVILFLGSGALLSAVSVFIFNTYNKIPGIRSNSLRWGLRDLNRLKASTTTAFLSLGLGMLLLNLIPQLKASINTEIQQPESSKVPSLFMFDIQEEQVDVLKNIFEKQQIVPQQISPMVRSKLITVNGKNFEKQNVNNKALTREQEREMRFRNRGFNLSYRPQLGDTEEILEGRKFSGVYDINSEKPAEISMETRFADRLGLNIGDQLTFDIQGVEVKGEIINLRSVKWTTFQPNFFILFQQGVLEMAPKTFLATIPKIDSEKIVQVQSSVVSELPNVSILDVSRLVKRLQSIITQMSLALEFMAYLCLFAGFVVLYSIANFQARVRSKEIGILKSLGADFNSIRNLFLWQYSSLAVSAGLFGAGLSLVFSFAISKVLFQGVWAADFLTPALTVAGSLILTLIVTSIATQKSLNTSARELL